VSENTDRDLRVLNIAATKYADREGTMHKILLKYVKRYGINIVRELREIKEVSFCHQVDTNQIILPTSDVE
jgi:hypothetical protein